MSESCIDCPGLAWPVHHLVAKHPSALQLLTAPHPLALLGLGVHLAQFTGSGSSCFREFHMPRSPGFDLFCGLHQEFTNCKGSAFIEELHTQQFVPSRSPAAGIPFVAVNIGCKPTELAHLKSDYIIDWHLLTFLGNCRIFNYAEYQIDYLLGACGRSLVSGYGSGYPTYVWHKYSYNAYIDWPLRGQYSFYGNVRGPWTTPTTGPDGPIYVQVSPHICCSSQA